MTLDELVERSIWDLVLDRERVAREAWELTLPSRRDRLTIFEVFRPGGFIPDWYVACRL